MGRRTKRQTQAMQDFEAKLLLIVENALLDGVRPYDAQRILAVSRERVSEIWRGVNREPPAPEIIEELTGVIAKDQP